MWLEVLRVSTTSLFYTYSAQQLSFSEVIMDLSMEDVLTVGH